MAEVYLASMHGPARFNKLLVIKRLKPALAEDQHFVRMFLDESRLAARLNHPNIVQTNEVGQEGDSYFMVMEYLEGQTLHAIHRQPEMRAHRRPHNLRAVEVGGATRAKHLSGADRLSAA